MQKASWLFIRRALHPPLKKDYIHISTFDPWPPGRETPPLGSHRNKMFMFMCLFFSWLHGETWPCKLGVYKRFTKHVASKEQKDYPLNFSRPPGTKVFLLCGVFRANRKFEWFVRIGLTRYKIGDRYDWTTVLDNGNGWRKFRAVPRLYPLRSLVLVLRFIGLLDNQGRAGDHFHCTVEPSPGHIRCRKNRGFNCEWFAGVFIAKVGPPPSTP